MIIIVNTSKKYTYIWNYNTFILYTYCYFFFKLIICVVNFNENFNKKIK
jgi:hypothetical protein